MEDKKQTHFDEIIHNDQKNKSLDPKNESEKEKSRFQDMQDKAKSKWTKFKKNLWNSEKKEFFGRTASSWAKILIFYFIFFYPLLFAFWSCMMFVLMQTLSDDKPKYTLDKSVIGTVPGLAFRPSPPTVPNSIESEVIRLDTNRTDSTKHLTSSLTDFLEPYFDKQGGAVNCSREQPTGRNRVCLVSVVKGSKDICNYPKSNFGYDEGKPCFLLKLNRIYGWYPQSIQEAPDELKGQLQEAFETGLVYVTCAGETNEDRANLGKVNYYPKQGIPHYYYPFTNQKGYLSPFIFVQFGNLKRGVVVQVRCRAWFKAVDSKYFEQKTRVLIKIRVD